jgi:hypothetical protein
MNTTTKYMTLLECKRYKELAAKHGEPALFAMSLPCSELSLSELPLKVKTSPKRKTRTKRPAKHVGR